MRTDNLYSVLDFVSMIKSRMRWVEYGIGMRERIFFNIFFENCQGKKSVGICWRSLEGNRNTNVKYEGWNFNFGNTPLDWIQELLE